MDAKAIDNLAGIHYAVPAVEYHAVDAVSASRLKDMRRSALHCRHALDTPKESDALAFGAAFHSYVLERETHWTRYAVRPDFGDCRNKDNKARRDAWELSAQGMTVTDAADQSAIEGMAAGLARHPAAAMLLTESGANEVSAFWRDDEHGADCKLRADRLVNVPGFGTVCLDLKTTRDASPEGFAREVRQYGYHLQGAWYLHGLARCGVACEAFVIAAVEKAPPYAVAVYRMDDESIGRGWRECRRTLAAYAEAKRSGLWKGYSEKIELIGLPAWATRDDDGQV